jgi:zinc protease
MTFLRRFAFLLAGLLFLTSTPAAALAEAKAAAKGWPQSTSDIPADPDIRFGMLPNGMRYAVMHNATPTGQAALRLYIDAGSMMETDAEQGIAHFLEHMTFEGSKKVPNGEMIKILQRHGLAFGADTNAQTSWDQTVYQLDLPTTDQDTVDTGLMLLREGASELLIAPDAINRERGVILSEERLRDTPGLRVFKSGIGFFLKGQLASDRLPIGKVPVLQGADHALIAGFYHKYYRPDRAVLVAVGDFNPDAMVAKIKARFSDWAATGPAGPEPNRGEPAKRGLETRLVIEPGAPLSIQIQWLKPADLSPDSKAKRRRETIEQLGLAVFNRRLGQLARSSSPPFIAAQASKDDEFRSAEPTVLNIAAQPGQWRAALAAGDQEARRLVQFGVRQDELDREIQEQRVQMQAAVEEAPTRKTTALAGEIVDTLDDHEVATSPAEDLSLFEDFTKTLTAAEVSAALRDVFSGEGPLVFMASPTPVDGGEPGVADVYTKAHATPVEASKDTGVKTWPYADFGKPGKVAGRKSVEDLGATFVEFANGVRLTVKPTKFRDNQVLVRVRIGHGLLDLPRDHVTTNWAARGAFTEGGLKALSAEDVERILAGDIYGADYATSDDAFVLQGVTRPADLQVQMQVLAAYATAPGFRPEAFQRMKSYAATLYDQMEATASGVLGRELSQMLHSGDPRFASLPTPSEVAASTPDQFKAQFEPLLASSPVEVVIVGDTTLDKAIAATAATFGALPPRAAAPAPGAAAANVLPPKPTATPVTLTHKGRADQSVAYAAWPADGFFADPQQARTLRVMAQIMENRLTEGLRETEGATYSPQAGSNASLVFPHFGYVSSVVEIPPAKIDVFYRDLAKIAADLKSTPVSADELERTKKPLLEGLQKSRQTNEYWLEQLSGAQAEPRKIDAVRTVIDSLKKVDAAAVQEAAKTYLRDDKLWKLEITPQGAASVAAAH